MNATRGLLILIVLLTMSAVMLLGIMGCVGGHELDEDEEGSGLVRCRDCNELEQWLKLNATLRMQMEIAGNRGDYWYDDDDDVVPPGGEDFLDDDDDDDDNSGNQDQGSDDDSTDDHSDTNVQEQGVDEADIVKTDGERLFVLAGGHLMLFDPDVLAQTHELFRYDVEGTPLEMYLYEDTVLVFSVISSKSLPDTIWPQVPRTELVYSIFKFTLLDVSDSSEPVLLREAYVEGDYVNSRRIDGSTRIVIYSQPQAADLDTWVNWDDYCDWYTGECDDEAMEQAWEDLEKENSDKINNTDLEDWLPRYYEIVYQDGQELHNEQMLVECENHFRPLAPKGNGLLTVMTVVLEDPMSKQPDIGLIADRGIVYASTEALYVAEDQDVMWDWDGFASDSTPSSTSDIHKFNISTNPQQAIYQGSGAVNGYVLNQFSMSENNGYLRIATTSGFWMENLTNAVYILSESNGVLNIVGSLTGIAPGEDIYAARFIGDRGFLVTFEQTDPLFTMNLADPTQPLMVGELEVPGYSTYLHPMGDNHLLAIGVTGEDFGLTGGINLAIFDVSDFANPVMAHNFAIGENWSASSEAQYDHKAFLYYEPMDLLAIPVFKWGYYYGYDDDDDDDSNWPEDKSGKQSSEDYSGIYAFRCTTSSGFEQLFDAEHTDFEGEPTTGYAPEIPWAKRSVVIGNYLYTLSDLGLLVTDLTTYEDILSIDLPWEDNYDDYYYDYDDEDEEGGDW